MDPIDLATGKKKIYLATRLYDFSEKLASAKLEVSIFQGVKTALTRLGLKLRTYPIFMPYRDTNEDLIENDADFDRKIYEQEIYNLEKAYALVAYLNDPSKDDGVCMEIGFSYGKGHPILVFNIDIQEYCTESFEDLPYNVDPILHAMIGFLFHSHLLPQASFEPNESVSQMLRFAQDYRARLASAEAYVLLEAQQLVVDLIESPTRYIKQLDQAIAATDVFIDFNGNREEWAREYSQRLKQELEKNNLSVETGERNNPLFLYNLRPSTVIQVGNVDIKKLIQAQVVLINVDGSEADAGGSALIGLARAHEKYIVLYYSSSTNIVAGSAKRYRNLMLEYSANAIARSLNECAKQVLDFFKSRA